MDNKYTYLSSLIRPITNPCNRGVLIKDLLSGRPRSYLASPNAVVLDEEQGKLYTWTGERWDDFYPDQFTDYDGPNPYEKKKFHYIGITPYMPYDYNCTVKLMPAGMVGVIACSKDELTTYNASVLDVVQHCGRLYTFTAQNHWIQFIPGPCDNYDGPNPYEKKVWMSTGPLCDTPLAKMIREETDVLKDLLRNNKEEKNMALEFRYLGTAQNALHDGSKGQRVFIGDRWEGARNRDLVLKDDSLYCFIEDKNEWKKITSFEFEKTVKYSSIPYGYLFIDKVVFNDPATIVFWKDGSKTIVKCGENESFDPEKGLAMAIAKKSFGNQGNYYNQIKKWLPEPKENDGEEYLTITERLNKIFGDPRIADAKKKLAAVQDLICNMTFNGATKTELVRAIRFSKDLIDFSKGADVDIAESVTKNGIEELEAKYQPK